MFPGFAFAGNKFNLHATYETKTIAPASSHCNLQSYTRTASAGGHGRTWRYVESDAYLFGAAVGKATVLRGSSLCVMEGVKITCVPSMFQAAAFQLEESQEVRLSISCNLLRSKHRFIFVRMFPSSFLTFFLPTQLCGTFSRPCPSRRMSQASRSTGAPEFIMRPSGQPSVQSYHGGMGMMELWEWDGRTMVGFVKVALWRGSCFFKVR